MNTKTFSEAMNEIDDRYLEKALVYRRPAVSGYRLKWGIAAACLGLLVSAVCLSRYYTVPLPDKKQGTTPPGRELDQYASNADGGVGGSELAAGKGPELGGSVGSLQSGGNISGSEPVGDFPDGVDPLISSIAVYPPSEKIQDVDTATINTIDETAVSALEPFCAHLPRWLPEDFHFRQASLYETTMKDGTKYHMLRITYTNGTQKEILTGVDEDGEAFAVAPNPEEWGDELTFHMWDFQPDIQQEIYVLETLFKYKDIPGLNSSVNYKAPFDTAAGPPLYFNSGDIYIGVFPGIALSSKAIEPADLINIICSMQ